VAITEQLEHTRQLIADEMKATKEEIVFVRGCTEGINLVATYFERAILKEGDEVVITMMAHDSNFLPCEMACNQTKAILKVLPITGSGEID
jgi:cysteine desulfurase/selenocysteine lyase